MDVHTIVERCDFENSKTIRTSFYTERIKLPVKQKPMKAKIGQLLKKMLPLR